MKVKRIEIKNYKGILDEQLEFNENLNVFIGSNGAGKTTMLEAIVRSLIQWTRNFASPGDDKLSNLKINDINYGKDYCSIILDVNKLKLYDSKGTLREPRHNFRLFQEVGILPDDLSLNKQNFRQLIQNDVILYKERIKLQSDNVPILKFYPANRGVLSYRKSSQKIYSSSQFEAWANIIHEDVSYSRFFNWFLENEIKELRMQKEAVDFSIQNVEIKYVRTAIVKAFEILKGKTYKISSEEIKKEGTNSLIPVLTLHENGEKNQSENLNNKSDGEKAIITLIADIAYNLSIATIEEDKDNSLNGSGIVLIDEIEAHLHPKWQREIIPLLTQLFPNIQFFITTHSPQVISSVSSENIFVGEDFKFSKINIKSKGLDSNTLLKHIFNTTTRPKHYVELLEQFDAVMEKKGSIDELEILKNSILELDKEDDNLDVSQLESELNLSIEAYKFDLEHEAD